MPKIVIADTSCLIVLDKIQSLSILHKLYSEILITPEIAVEYSSKLPDWIKIERVSNLKNQNIQIIKPILEELKRIKFRLSPEVERDILHQCNEL